MASTHNRTPRPPLARTAGSDDALALRIATDTGLTGGARTRRLNAKVTPALFEAAARRAGSRSPTVVVEAALAALATQDDLGPWLAARWGTLGDIGSDVLDELGF